MRTISKIVTCLAVTLGVWGFATPASAIECVGFVHGTGDQNASGAANYWDDAAQFAAGRQYKIVDYPGTSYAAFEEPSWGRVVYQLHQFAQNKGCTSMVVVTHSNGSNVLRQMAMHQADITSAANGSVPVSSVMNIVTKVVTLAPDGLGTQLADLVTTAGTLANVANELVADVGLGNYNTPAVWAQRRDNMQIYNNDGTFSDQYGACGNRNDCNGIPTDTTVGRGVNAKIWSSAAWCGGTWAIPLDAYAMSVGLKITHAYAFGSIESDGFLPADAQAYNGFTIYDSAIHSVGTNWLNNQVTLQLNHNQSRHDCQGLERPVRDSVAAALWDPSSWTPPADYAAAPHTYACDMTRNLTDWDVDYCIDEGWFGCSEYYARYWHHSDYALACPSSWRNDGWEDVSCATGHKSDESVELSSDFYTTPYNNQPWWADSSPSYGSCSDSRRGDGVCDLCLVAKYGYDGMPGQSNGAGDCAYNGYQNKCRDLWYDHRDGHFQYITYLTNHVDEITIVGY